MGLGWRQRQSREGGAAGGGMRNGGCGGVQGAEAGDTGAVGLLAPEAHPTARRATRTRACVNTSLSRCLCRASGEGGNLMPCRERQGGQEGVRPSWGRGLSAQ